MFGLIGKDFFEVVWFGIWTLAAIYSLATYGYMVWFKPEEFMKMDEERKMKSPRWLRFFMMSTTPYQDLWMMRIVYALVFPMILVLLFVILRKLFGGM